MIATHATMANHPNERMIHVQTAACAAVRKLILAALRNLNVTLISSSNRRKQKGFPTILLSLTVADWPPLAQRVVSWARRTKIPPAPDTN
jgi:hypothetical protein